MELVNKKFYEGYEGEIEIRFIRETATVPEVLVIWEGFFDQIMSAIKPEKNGWTGLAYHYNMYSGWYDNDMWAIDDLDTALNQLKSVDVLGLYQECSEVLQLVCRMLEKAIAEHQNVYISRE